MNYNLGTPSEAWEHGNMYRKLKRIFRFILHLVIEIRFLEDQIAAQKKNQGLPIAGVEDNKDLKLYHH